MEEYIDNGMRLGWLIDRTGQQVGNCFIEIKKGASVMLSGKDVLAFAVSLPL